MTVKQIASAAAELLAADGLCELLAATDPDGTDPDVKAIVRCVQAAADELYTSGFASTECERLAAENGLIALSAFGKAPTVIRSVTRNGSAVKFGFDSRGVSVRRDGEYDVAYVPQTGELALDDALSFGGGADTLLAAQLTARNYCLVTGRADEARVWDGLYSDGCARLRMTRRARIPSRTWA